MPPEWATHVSGYQAMSTSGEETEPVSTQRIQVVLVCVMFFKSLLYASPFKNKETEEQ